MARRGWLALVPAPTPAWAARMRAARMWAARAPLHATRQSVAWEMKATMVARQQARWRKEFANPAPHAPPAKPPPRSRELRTRLLANLGIAIRRQRSYWRVRARSQPRGRNSHCHAASRGPTRSKLVGSTRPQPECSSEAARCTTCSGQHTATEVQRGARAVASPLVQVQAMVPIPAVVVASEAPPIAWVPMVLPQPMVLLRPMVLPLPMVLPPAAAPPAFLMHRAVVVAL